VIDLESIRAALAFPDFDAIAAQRRMAPSDRPFTFPAGLTPRQSAVLILLYPLSLDNSDLAWHFPLMRRVEYPGVHSGQISLPGGQSEPGETWEQTALRETCEEVGVCDGIEVLGPLTPIYVPPSNFQIHPFVGACMQRPTFKIDPLEVADLMEIPLHLLLDEARKRHDEREFVPGHRAQLPYYWLGESVVWGATAIILSEFEHRLRAVLSTP